MKLCPYHKDNLGWDTCSEGFKGCQYKWARKKQKEKDAFEEQCRRIMAPGYDGLKELFKSHGCTLVKGGTPKAGMTREQRQTVREVIEAAEIHLAAINAPGGFNTASDLPDIEEGIRISITKLEQLLKEDGK